VEEFANRIDAGTVDLTDIPFDVLDSADGPELAASATRFLRQIDHPSSSIGGDYSGSSGWASNMNRRDDTT
jgi:hypothetical protein